MIAQNVSGIFVTSTQESHFSILSHVRLIFLWLHYINVIEFTYVIYCPKSQYSVILIEYHVPLITVAITHIFVHDSLQEALVFTISYRQMFINWPNASIFFWSGEIFRNGSSLQLLVWVLNKSELMAKILWLSSCKKSMWIQHVNKQSFCEKLQ